MTERKTAAELAADYAAAYELMKPSEAAFHERFREFTSEVNQFFRTHSWYDSEWKWVQDLDRVDIHPGNILAGVVYVADGFDEYTVSIEALDNITSILEAEYAAHLVKNAKVEKENKERKRAALLSQLAALDSE